ncbi:Uncharacterised protein [uncultured Flavonifractor sp.]|nr:Uncharacterised protein [uncultured Flavonifractor sp.]
MNLLIFSMPADTPSTRTRTVRATAMKCQGTEPKSTARVSKKAAESPDRTEPVTDPAMYRSTQPTTTE